MAGSLGFRRQYCIPKGKASAGYRFADHLRSGGKALRRADRCGLSCSVYGRECLLEFFRQRVSNHTDLGDLAGQARPAGADGDGAADLEAIEAGDRKPRHNEPMLADDFDHRLAWTHHRAGAAQDFADNTSIIDRSLASS